MINVIWAGMILLGILYAFFTGNISTISEAALSYTGEAVSLCITMAGILAFWVGLMEIAKSAGLVEKLTKLLQPVIRSLFPEIPKDHQAEGYISMNIVANILGLGWACTPAGLKAMEQLALLNHKKNQASDSMCAFLILNISSLQLIPITMIGYRKSCGSTQPTAIILPAILATTVSTLTGIAVIKAHQILIERKRFSPKGVEKC